MSNLKVKGADEFGKWVDEHTKSYYFEIIQRKCEIIADKIKAENGTFVLKKIPPSDGYEIVPQNFSDELTKQILELLNKE